MDSSMRAKRLNRRAANHSALKIVDDLNIQSGETIIDIGAGGGLLTFEFSKLVGLDGLIIAADIDNNLLKYIELEHISRGIKNIRTLNVENIQQLQQYKYDLIFMRNVFHHLQNRVDYFITLRSCLKQNGRIAIIDWNNKATFFMKISGHYTPEQIILDTMTASGFVNLANYQHLKGQSFNIFSLNTI